MAKTLKSFRLTAAAEAELARRKAATGQSEGDIISALLARRATTTRRLLNVYRAISQEIQALEFEGELTPEEDQLLAYLNELSDQMRDRTEFWEPRLLENDSQTDYLLDAQGQHILDPKHEKTRPWDV